MHKSSMLRMEWFVDNYASKINKDKIKILDVGSCDVNGSYKNIFSDKKYEYIGLDMEEGPNVNIVLNNPYDWSEISTDSYDIIISGQAFEHVEFFWITMAEIARVLKQDGLLCLIVPNGFVEHRFPVDCYRFFSDGMVALARYVCLDVLHAHTNSAPIGGSHEWYSKTEADTLLIAKKPYSGSVKHVDLNTYKCVPANQEILRTGFIPYNSKKRISIKSLWSKSKNR